MKLLQVIHSADPLRGGVSAGVSLSSEFMVKAGHEVTHVTVDDPAAVADIQLPGDFIAVGPGKSGYGYCPALDDWLANHLSQFDAAIVNGVWQYPSFAVWRQARKLGASAPPYFVFTHGMMDPWFKRTYPLKHFKKWLYWPWAEYRVLRDARAVLFTCEEEKILARQSFWLYRAREQVVGYGTQLPDYSTDEMNDAWHKLCPAKQGQPYLLYLGRLHEKKGADLLVKAYCELKKNGQCMPDLILAGPEQDASFTNQLRQLAASDPHIHFAGMITGAAKWGALAHAEAMVLPSHQENFGIVVAEALAMGTPALISNKVNIWREVEQSGAGIVTNDDLDGVRSLLQQFLSLSPEEKSQMKRSAKLCFAEYFLMEKNTNDLLAFIQQELATANER
ncbi:glycosyltransferase [Cerasicoccus fimbriatus]|uniref:glycosyltransferase n=1 Tax=Cerasicoccus fimbriatus TaxID=3014554 RepID=UPI0022B2EFDA|nr:glycosyltransferase [Cerasicoccus sp. TK19100]